MMGARTELVIDRLTVKSTDRRTAGEAERALRAAHWPAPEGERWLIVRRMHLRGRPRELGKSVARAAATEASRSVWGGAPGAASAPSVWFRSLAELLARLSADLALGRETRWFWRRWAPLFDLPPGPALARLWGDHIAQVATVIAELDASGDLPRVWRTLDPPAAQSLVAALSIHAGVALPVVPDPTPTGTLPATRLPDGVRRRWRTALSGLPETDHRVWLAAAFTALELGALASAEPVPARIAAIGRALGGGQDSASSGAAPVVGSGPVLDAPETGAHRQGARPGHGAAARDEALRAAAGTDSAATGERAAPRPATPRHSSPHAEPEPSAAPARRSAAGVPPPSADRRHRRGAAAEGGVPAGRRADSEPAAPADGTPAASVLDDVETAFGGAFYLVNLLNHASFQTLLRGREGWGEPLAGWWWLARASMHLGLDPDDPLSAFLAARLECPDPGELARMPPLPRAMAAAATATLGEVWAPSLIAVPGLLRHTPSHIDVHFPAAAVRLEVRLAGLDINPGWVPWLGRVVTFHYDDLVMGAAHG